MYRTGKSTGTESRQVVAGRGGAGMRDPDCGRTWGCLWGRRQCGWRRAERRAFRRGCPGRCACASAFLRLIPGRVRAWLADCVGIGLGLCCCSAPTSTLLGSCRVKFLHLPVALRLPYEVGSIEAPASSGCGKGRDVGTRREAWNRTWSLENSSDSGLGSGQGQGWCCPQERWC